jgi:hypothetical protein
LPPPQKKRKKETTTTFFSKMHTYWKHLKLQRGRKEKGSRKRTTKAVLKDYPPKKIVLLIACRKDGRTWKTRRFQQGKNPGMRFTTSFSPTRRSKEISRQIAELEISLDTRYSCDFDARYFDLRQQWWEIERRGKRGRKREKAGKQRTLHVVVEVPKFQVPLAVASKWRTSARTLHVSRPLTRSKVLLFKTQ